MKINSIIQFNKTARPNLFLTTFCWFVLQIASPQSCFASQPVFDITGDWDSKYGAVTFKVEGLEKTNVAIVSGTYSSGNNKAQIVWGRLYKNKDRSTLKIEYYMDWKPLYGYAEFILDPIGGKLNGKYFQANQNGSWILTRRSGPKLSMVTNLAVIKKPNSKRGSKVFTVTGDWDSNFGKVNLVGTSLAAVKQVKGEFKRADGKIGKITSGSFTKTFRGGKLQYEYYCPWNKVKGKAVFYPDQKVGGKMLIGTYQQGTQKGTWTMCRPYKAN